MNMYIEGSQRSLINFMVMSLFGASCGEDPYRYDKGTVRTLNGWCADRPCGWELESGAIEPVSTWHEAELGVGFLEASTAISTRVTSPGNFCWAFEVSADVEPEARLVLETDYLIDGQIEHRRVISAQGFEFVTLGLADPGHFPEVQLRLKLETAGRAHVARIYSLERPDARLCFGQTAPEVNDRPDGLLCDEDSQCQSGRCSCEDDDEPPCWMTCGP